MSTVIGSVVQIVRQPPLSDLQVAAQMLATANHKVLLLTKALAHIGCSCVVKSRLTELSEHDPFCKFRMKLEDLL